MGGGEKKRDVVNERSDLSLSAETNVSWENFAEILCLESDVLDVLVVVFLSLGSHSEIVERILVLIFCSDFPVYQARSSKVFFCGDSSLGRFEGMLLEEGEINSYGNGEFGDAESGRAKYVVVVVGTGLEGIL